MLRKTIYLDILTGLGRYLYMLFIVRLSPHMVYKFSFQFFILPLENDIKTLCFLC